jgi:inosose dehydratase
MLDELRATGYFGTKLGDWGYLPTDPATLAAELARRELALVGAFVPAALKYAETHAEGKAEAIKVAGLLAAVGETLHDPQLPLLILAVASGTDPVRTQHAGRITPAMGLSAAQWATLTDGAKRTAHAVRAATGIPTAFHHHCAGYVETPAEIAHFLERTDPAVMGLVLDTGHYLLGAGGADGQGVVEALERWGERIRHVHFKDCRSTLAAQARAQG